jgi:hypothetical protein
MRPRYGRRMGMTAAMHDARKNLFSRSFGEYCEDIRRRGERSRRRSGGRPINRSLRSEGLSRALAGLNALEFARKALGFEPDEAQARVLERAWEFRQIGLNCSRQWGKSTIAAVLAVQRMVMEPGVTVLVVGPSARQSGETVRKVREFLGAMGFRKGELRGDGVNPRSMVLPNGSRIVGLPGREETVRGFSAVSMLIVDEAARVEDEVYLALRPSLAVANGDVILLSTPRGKRGFFYREMTEGGGEGWLRHTGTVGECKRIPEEFLAKERERGEAFFRQEYMCEFVESGKYLFSEALVRSMIKPGEKAWGWL